MVDLQHCIFLNACGGLEEESLLGRHLMEDDAGDRRLAAPIDCLRDMQLAL